MTARFDREIQSDITAEVVEEGCRARWQRREIKQTYRMFVDAIPIENLGITMHDFR